MLTLPPSSDFLKRDDQILANRLQQEERLNARKKAAVDIDRARAYAHQDGVPYNEPDPDLDEDVTMDDATSDNYGAKTIVIHIGSQNLRLGLATDALPKTVPMVIARKSKRSEADDREPLPKRQKLDEDAPSEEWFGDEVRSRNSHFTCTLTDYSSPKSTTPWQQTSNCLVGRTSDVCCPTPVSS